MAKQKLSITEENPTREEILTEEPAAQGVTESESEEKAQPLAEIVAKVPDISATLSAQIAQAAKDEAELKKIEEKEGVIFEEQGSDFSTLGSDDHFNSWGLYALFALSALAGTAAYFYFRKRESADAGRSDDKQLQSVPDQRAAGLGLGA